MANAILNYHFLPFPNREVNFLSRKLTDLSVSNVVRELGEDNVGLVSVAIGIDENLANSHGPTAVLQSLLHGLPRP